MNDKEIIQRAFEIAERQSKLIDKAFATMDSDILKAIKKEHDSLSNDLKELRKIQKASR